MELETTRKNQYVQLTENLQNTLICVKEPFKTTQSKFTGGKVDTVIYISVKNELLSSEYDFKKNVAICFLEY